MDLARLDAQSDGSVGEQVYHALREAIVSGRVRPSQRLVQAEVAAALGVSRMPVREAIRRLETEGLLCSLPNHSTMAVWFTAEDVEHIYGLRARLEGYAAFLLAQRDDHQTLDALEEICRAYREARPREQDLLNLRFHRTIIEGCRVQRVISAALGMVQTNLLQQLNRTLSSSDRQRAGREHEAIVHALRERKGDEAEVLVRRHMEWAAQLLAGKD